VAIQHTAPFAGVVSVGYNRRSVEGDVVVGGVALIVGVIPVQISLEDVARDIDVNRSRRYAIEANARGNHTIAAIKLIQAGAPFTRGL